MRFAWAALALLAAAGAAEAQRHKLVINAETPEGQLLQQIGTESDEAKKLGLLEQFASQYGKHEAMAWVYEQMIAAYAKAGNNDKALEAGDKLLAIDPEDVVSAHAALKAAEAKKDPDAILKWSNTTSAIARKIAAAPKPPDEDEDDWKRQVDFAKQVDVYTEYSLYAAVLQTPDPQKKVLLGEALEKRNPDSQYFPQVAEQTFIAMLQTGKGEQAVALADRVLAKHEGSPEMLLAVAGSAMAKQHERAIALATKALDTTTKPKPEGVTDADWQARQKMLAGRANWIIGRVYAEQMKWSQADKALRAALPGIQGEKGMLAEALFFLGLANYRLGEAGDTDRIRDAVQFNTQCAALPGPYAARAKTNLAAIRSQYRVK